MLPLFLIIYGCNSSTPETYHVTPMKGAEVHKTPSNSGKVIGRLEQSEEVDVISIEGRWVKINYHGREAYVSKRYISKGKGHGGVWITLLILVLVGAGIAEVAKQKGNGVLDKILRGK